MLNTGILAFFVIALILHSNYSRLTFNIYLNIFLITLLIMYPHNTVFSNRINSSLKNVSVTGHFKSLFLVACSFPEPFVNL